LAVKAKLELFPYSFYIAFSNAKKHKPPIFSRKIGGLFTEYGGEGEIRNYPFAVF
jgi:hypothetical protein